MKLNTPSSAGVNALGLQAGPAAPAAAWLQLDKFGRTRIHDFVRTGRISQIPPGMLDLKHCLLKDRDGVTVLREIAEKEQIEQIPNLHEDAFKALGKERQIEWEEALETNGAAEAEIERLKRITQPKSHNITRPELEV